LIKKFIQKFFILFYIINGIYIYIIAGAVILLIVIIVLFMMSSTSNTKSSTKSNTKSNTPINTPINTPSNTPIKEVKLYGGNNGTVSGDTFCAGDWGNNGTNKNMTCVKQTDAATAAILECSKSYATAAGIRPTNSWCT